ncbi:MAG: sugar nucleotide-binding protein [Actinomycetota bacterium]
MTAPKLLVTGGGGLLGSRLALQAASSGWDVTATVRRAAAPSGIRPVPADLRDAVAVAALLEEVDPDVVVHTAYDKADNGDDSVTVAGTAALAGARGRLVLTSTDLVFSGRAGRPYTEADEPDPTLDYGRGKRRAEQLVPPDGLIVRLPLLVDVSEGEQVELVRASARGEATLFTDELRCPALVDDVAASILELLARERTGAVHLGGAAEVDRATLGRLLAPHAGIDPDSLSIGPTPDSLIEAGRPSDVRLDSSLAAGLGLRPRSIIEALRA